MIETLEPPPTRRETRKQERRQAIINAARASFLEHGYAGTSMSALLKTLGGSKATLWGYFRSKEELFAAVIEEVSAGFRAELDDVLTLDGAFAPSLIAFCRAFIRKINSPEALATWRLVVAESGRFPEVGQIFYERAAKRTRDMLSAFLSRQIRNGLLRDENADHMAETLLDLCAGSHTRRLWGVDDPAFPNPKDPAAEICRLFIRLYSTEV